MVASVWSERDGDKLKKGGGHARGSYAWRARLGLVGWEDACSLHARLLHFQLGTRLWCPLITIIIVSTMIIIIIIIIIITIIIK